MEFDHEGGLLTVDLIGEGLFEVHVPWAVATEHWKIEHPDTGVADEELRLWMVHNKHRYVEMVGARYRNPGTPSERDDPRVTAKRLPEAR
jgi:hypothetical protein